MKETIEKINKEIKDCPETIFDEFDLSINTKLLGFALRERIVELSNLYSRISYLFNNALLLWEKAKIRRDRVEAIAWSSVDKSLKVSDKKIAAKSLSVVIDGERTTLIAENERVAIYGYIHNKGKNKMQEMSSKLDIARSLLSWDKTEQSKVQYD